ncbi:hypothetical protein [Streptomyces noursei]|uniref:hypothetical protein n=1 Tax=Streptomyces noursei TaxID=1971 RepID=UPI001672CF4D|nr:hypothetical protein [Streptomyces noursei]MCZ1020350.1 hypothetical protein [Streptomyces noursei]GGX14494.1 hypothetical protein GCM10010341_40190 [Streptomyces noursei]
MPKKRLRNAEERTYGAPSLVLRRSLIGGIILAVLLVVVGLVAYFNRTPSPASSKPDPHTTSAQPSAPSPEATASGKGVAVAAPPKTSDPVVFAKAATKALWTYDTRAFSQAEHLAGLKRWMTGEKKYADWKSVTDQVPSPVLWARMHDNHQHASASIGEGHFPQAFKTALAQDPGAITQAYLYAVTVTGSQTLTWQGSGAGAEARSMTLAVQCRPHQDCALAAVLPNAAP